MDRDADTETPMIHPNVTPQAGRRLKQYVAATSASLGPLCAGTVLAWTSPALAQLSPSANTTNSSSIEDIPKPFTISENEAALVGGIVAIGALASAIPAGFLADKFGRKKIILSISVAFLLNWILIVSARSSSQVIAARFFAGMGTGAICVTAPMYLGEIAETSIRGILGSFFQMGLSLGILLTSVVGAVTNWFILSIVLMFVPAIFGLSFIFMPESPVYLVEIGQMEEAKKILTQFRGEEYDVDGELRGIQKEIREAREKTAGIKDMFTSKSNRRAFVAVVGVLAFQQLCGINAVVFYTVPIFEDAGSSLSPNLVGIIVALVQVGASYFSILIIEKANRKFYLMLSSAGMMLFQTGLAMFFHLKQLDFDITHIGFIPVGSAVLFMAFFCVGYGPIPWMLMGELFSPEIKGVANGFAILTNWSCAFLVTFCFPIISNSIGAHVAFYSFAAIMAVATLYVYFLVPETRGKSLPEIQETLSQ